MASLPRLNLLTEPKPVPQSEWAATVVPEPQWAMGRVYDPTAPDWAPQTTPYRDSPEPPPSRLEPSPGFANYLRDHYLTAPEADPNYRPEWDEMAMRRKMVGRLMANPLLAYQFAWKQIKPYLSRSD